MTDQPQCLKLDHVSSIRYGSSIHKDFIHKQPSIMKFVQSRNFSIDGIDWADCDYTNFVGTKEPLFLEQGDVLFFIRYEGDNAMVIDSSIKSIGIKAIAGPLVFVLRCDTNKILPEYLAWWLNQAPSQAYFKSKDIDGKRKSITRETLEETPICMPTIEQQKMIIDDHESTVNEIIRLQAKADGVACKIQESSMPMRQRFIYE